jgi:hypothetical protein
MDLFLVKEPPIHITSKADKNGCGGEEEKTVHLQDIRSPPTTEMPVTLVLVPYRLTIRLLMLESNSIFASFGFQNRVTTFN